MADRREVIAAAIHETRGLLAGDVLIYEDCLTLADAVLAALGAAIAHEIRRELVCCDVYDRLAPLREPAEDGGIEASRELGKAIGDHDLCYWGEAAAQIAEDYGPTTHPLPHCEIVSVRPVEEYDLTVPCNDEREPDGERCTGQVRYQPGDVQAACDTCGGWRGRWAPRG